MCLLICARKIAKRFNLIGDFFIRVNRQRHDLYQIQSQETSFPAFVHKIVLYSLYWYCIVELIGVVQIRGH